MCRLRGKRNEARARLFRQSLLNTVELTIRTEPAREATEEDVTEPAQAITLARPSVRALDSSLRALPSGEPSLGEMLSQARAQRPDYQRWSR